MQLASSNQEGEEAPWQLEASWTGGETPSIERFMEESEQHGLCTVSHYTPSPCLRTCALHMRGHAISFRASVLSLKH